MNLFTKYFNLLKIPQKRKRRKEILNFLVEYNQTKDHFHVGDKVESYTGQKGEVILVYKDIKTDLPVGCAVRWDDEVAPGSQLSLFLPVANFGTRFNPIIRKIKETYEKNN